MYSLDTLKSCLESRLKTLNEYLEGKIPQSDWKDYPKAELEGRKKELENTLNMMNSKGI